jgi:D-glycero-alpha-D-manno-heptose-7-phosphate kinase
MDVILRARAPLRISFAGGGTDVSQYANKYGGAVISTTIDKYAYVSIKETNSGGITVTSQDYDTVNSINIEDDHKNDETVRLVHAVLKHLNVKNMNLDINTTVDAIPGSGLGSSSSIVVALTGAHYKLFNKPFTSYDIANISYKIERIDCGIKGGLQDQYSAAFGGFNFIEFNKSSVIVTPLRIKGEILNELLSSFLLVDTGQRREHLEYDRIIENQIMQTEQNTHNAIENLHYIKKLAYEMKDLLLKGDVKKFGEKLGEGWEHKKAIDASISNPKIDQLYQESLNAGSVGGKLLGAGGGGHLLLFTPIEKRSKVIKAMKKNNATITGFNFDVDGLKTWAVSENGTVL